MEGLILFGSIKKLNYIQSFLNNKKFCKLKTSFNHGNNMASSSLWKRLYLTISNTFGVPCIFLQTHVVDGKPPCNCRCYSHWPIGRCYINDVYDRCYAKYVRWNTTAADIIITIKMFADCVNCAIYGWCYINLQSHRIQCNSN